MIKAILFDMDGVVINSEPLYEKVETELFTKYGFSVPEEDLKLFKGTTEKDFFDLVESRYRPKWNRQEVIDEGRRLLIHIFSRELAFIPGFVGFIEKIKGRYLTGLVTSTPRKLFDDICTILPIREIFHEIICAEDISNGKPHPEPYLTMMRRLSISPKETVILEDSINGITSAKASGAKCIALTSSMSRDDFSDADIVVTTLDEITETLINSLGDDRETEEVKTL